MLLFKPNPQKDERSVRTLTGSTVMKTEAISSSENETRRDRWYDPLAQSSKSQIVVVYSLLVAMFTSKLRMIWIFP